MPTNDDDPARERSEQKGLDILFPENFPYPKSIPLNPDSGGFIHFLQAADPLTRNRQTTAHIWGPVTKIVSGKKETTLMLRGRTPDIIEYEGADDVYPLQYVKRMHGKTTRVVRFDCVEMKDATCVVMAMVYELKDEFPGSSRKEMEIETVEEDRMRFESIGQIDLLRTGEPIHKDRIKDIRIVPLKSSSATADPGIVIALLLSSHNSTSVRITILHLTIHNGTLNTSIDEKTYEDIPLPQSLKPFTDPAHEAGLLLVDFKPEASTNRMSMVVEHIIPSSQSEWRRHTYKDVFESSTTKKAWSILVRPFLLLCIPSPASDGLHRTIFRPMSLFAVRKPYSYKLCIRYSQGKRTRSPNIFSSPTYPRSKIPSSRRREQNPFLLPQEQEKHLTKPPTQTGNILSLPTQSPQLLALNSSAASPHSTHRLYALPSSPSPKTSLRLLSTHTCTSPSAQNPTITSIRTHLTALVPSYPPSKPGLDVLDIHLLLKQLPLSEQDTDTDTGTCRYGLLFRTHRRTASNTTAGTADFVSHEDCTECVIDDPLAADKGYRSLKWLRTTVAGGFKPAILEIFGWEGGGVGGRGWEGGGVGGRGWEGGAVGVRLFAPPRRGRYGVFECVGFRVWGLGLGLGDRLGVEGDRNGEGEGEGGIESERKREEGLVCWGHGGEWADSTTTHVCAS